MFKDRPHGITYLAALEFAGGVSSVTLGGYYVNVLDGIVKELGLTPSNAPDFYTYFIAEVILGLVSVPLAYGLMEGKSWGGTLTGDYSVASLVFYVGFGAYFMAQYGDTTEITAGIPGLAVAALAAYYLSRPQVKDYFQGRRGASTAESGD